MPTFRIGARGAFWAEPDPESTAAKEVASFREVHHAARRSWRAGDRRVCFPYGTYEMRVAHRAVVADRAPNDALVSEPGPLLSEVRAELARMPPGPRAEVGPLLVEVEEGYAAQAAGVVEDEDLDLELDGRGRSASSDPQTRRRARVVERHRFDPHSGDQDARRVVTLRGRRERRRTTKTGDGRHGADPPG